VSRLCNDNKNCGQPWAEGDEVGSVEQGGPSLAVGNRTAAFGRKTVLGGGRVDE
jgi:hypothetical protein